MPRILAIVGAVLGLGALAAAGLGISLAPMPQGELAGRPPKLRPDYTDTVIPANVAPLNFVVDEDDVAGCWVDIFGSQGRLIRIRSNSACVAIPPAEWRELLSESRGGSITVAVAVQHADGSWVKYDLVENRVAPEPIDRYLVYRVINVLYNYYWKMRMFQYDVENAREELVLDNKSFGSGCMNCHTFLNGGTDHMFFHMRSGDRNFGYGMILFEDGKVTKVNTRTAQDPGLAAFSSWHPSGKVIAFSTNKVRQFFHTARQEVREGIDLKGDLSFYLVDQQKVVAPAFLHTPEFQETWPAWSADGRWLYFCRAPLKWSPEDEVPPAHWDDHRYDLCRVSFDLATREWGEIETVISADETGLSCSEPRASPDGRFLAFCMSKNSGFPALQPDADIYLMDLKSGEYRRLDCNSDQPDSWHSWSSNGRWLVFSSKRDDGLFMKPWFSYVDEDGVAHKPFVLPQREPDYYESFIRVYHLPEMCREPIPIRGEALARIIRSDPWVTMGEAVTGATPSGTTLEPAAGPHPDASVPWTRGPQ